MTSGFRGARDAAKAWLFAVGGRSLRVAGVLLTLGFLGALIRLVPLALVPGISLAAIVPFARSIAWLAAETCLLLALPLGLALSLQHSGERGELRTLAALGVSPRDGLRSLAPLLVVWGALLFAASWLGARDAESPGRVINQQLEHARAACGEGPEQKHAPQAVPFLTASWLCSPGAPPLLAGRAPVGGILFSAADARFSGDLREFSVQDASFQKGSVNIHVGEATFKGLPVFVRASPLRPLVRAAAVVAATLVSVLSLLGLWRFAVTPPRPALATLLGATGPLTALLVLRSLERIAERVPSSAFVAVPTAALLASVIVIELAFRLRPRKRPDILT